MNSVIEPGRLSFFRERRQSPWAGPTMSLYRERIYLRLHDELGLHLAQDGYWHSPSKMPAPAEWVTVRRERRRPSVEHVYAFSRTPHPRWSNLRVLQPYSPSMRRRLEKGR
jgi:hypothetical protein